MSTTILIRTKGVNSLWPAQDESEKYGGDLLVGFCDFARSTLNGKIISAIMSHPQYGKKWMWSWWDKMRERYKPWAGGGTEFGFGEG